MTDKNTYLEKLEKKVKTQLSSQNVAYLLGAGSSYLNGTGYPLANELWQNIKNGVLVKSRGQTP